MAKEDITEVEDFIYKTIASASPDNYYEGKPLEISKFKRLIKRSGFAYSTIKEASSKAAEEHKIVYDSTSETLEPVYFWILDFMNDLFSNKVEKLVDNFTSTPSSGHFAELAGRATRMQEEGMKILGSVNTVIKTIVNLLYDLREFEIRLREYDASKNKDKEKAEAGSLALKQIWMDNVDMKRGAGSINALASGNLNFVTLRDAFMACKSIRDVDTIDLNDRVKRILKPRLLEFLDWLKLSEKELRKRYEIQRIYLKSEVNALQLYTRWARPYLKAANELEMKEAGREPALVKAFNTILLELTIFGKQTFDFKQAVIDKELPQSFLNYKLKRDYYSCVFVDFRFRGIPQRTPQGHYAFGGRAEATFKAFALNQDEIDLLNEKLKEDDLNTALKFVEGTTTESLDKLREEVEYFLKEGFEEEKEEKKESEDTNPFAALFSFKKKEKAEKGKEKKEISEIKPDNYVEKMARKTAEKIAKDMCFNVFDIYKKAHGMASHPAQEE